MKTIYSLLLVFLIAFSNIAIADENLLNVGGFVYEHENTNPVPGYMVTIKIEGSNLFNGYFNEVFTNEDGYYSDEITLPEFILQGEVILSTIDCNGEVISILYFFSPENMNIEHNFILCDEPYNDCEAYYTWWPTDVPLTIQFMDFSWFDPDVWNWDFGDGTTANEPNPVHTYAESGVYEVCLTIIEGDYCMDTYCEAVVVNGNPNACHADFWWTPMEELFVQFHNNSFPENAEYVWLFGDDGTSTEVNPLHQYLQPGVYEVCLIMFNEELNCEDMTCYELWVGTNNYCQAYFEWEPLPDSPWTIQFYDESIIPDAINYLWEFGDGSTSSAQNPLHFYENSGIFEVCLTIFNDAGCEDTFCQEVNIEGIPGGLSASFEIGQDPNNLLTLHFWDTSTGNPGQWFWDFGDGNTSEEQNPVHTYENQGAYNVCLTIWGEDGESDTWCLEILLDGSMISSVSHLVKTSQLLKVYPNPANQFISMKFMQDTETVANVMINDQFGKQVLLVEKTLSPGENSKSIDVSDLPAGVYFIRLNNASDPRTGKFVIVR